MFHLIFFVEKEVNKQEKKWRMFNIWWTIERTKNNGKVNRELSSYLIILYI